MVISSHAHDICGGFIDRDLHGPLRGYPETSHEGKAGGGFKSSSGKHIDLDDDDSGDADDSAGGGWLWLSVLIIVIVVIAVLVLVYLRR